MSWATEEVERAIDHKLYGEDYIPEASIDDFALDELAGILSELDAMSSAVSAVKRFVKARLAETVGEGKAWRYGDRVFRVGPKRDWKIADPRGFVKWLGDDLTKVLSITPSSSFRKRGLQAVAEERGVEFDTVVNTFLDAREGELELQQLPLSRAPKFLQTMEEGEIR